MSDSIECPECRKLETRVVDSRPSYERGSIRRRRECLSCDYRWSTFEVDADRLALLEDQLRVKKREPSPETRPPSCL
jgi:transcriptional regulator NrdR family protein